MNKLKRLNTIFTTVSTTSWKWPHFSVSRVEIKWTNVAFSFVFISNVSFYHYLFKRKGQRSTLGQDRCFVSRRPSAQAFGSNAALLTASQRIRSSIISRGHFHRCLCFSSYWTRWLWAEPAACVAKARVINKCCSKGLWARHTKCSTEIRWIAFFFAAALLNPSIHADITAAPVT